MSQSVDAYGVITSVLGNNNFRVEVEVEGTKRDILCHLSGRMRQFKINVIPGDEVTVQIPPPYDKGRITFRGHKAAAPESSSRKDKRR